jgi:hypothetical protein
MANTNLDAPMVIGVPERIVDNATAPEIFADLLVGSFLKSGNVHMTFASTRSEPGKQPGGYYD